MFPLRDENPTFRTPYLTIGLIVLCVLVFLYQQTQGGEAGQIFVYRYGFIPSIFFGNESLPFDFGAAPAPVTMITSMFLHGGWMHLIGNMMFLWIFGNNIEDELGPIRFIIFYMAAGILAALGQGFLDTQSDIPMVGASGAISGILGAYILLFPRAKILTLIWLGIFVTTMRISAIWFLGIWFGLQWLNALTSGPDGGGVAWWAHIGGFIGGVVLLFLLKPRRSNIRTIRRGPWG